MEDFLKLGCLCVFLIACFQLEKFLRDNAKALKNMKSTLDITPGFVRMNIDWLKKYEERIRTWFDANI